MSRALHTFVVPAYGRSPHLEACLRSLRSQSASSQVVVSTSTPFDGIEQVCAAAHARLVVHGPNRGIGNDWNRALDAADTALVTVAHQDDVYHPGYATAMLDAHRRHPSAALYFCDSGEITQDGAPREGGMNLRIKRLLVAAAFLGRGAVSGPIARRLLLGLGNPIVCPAVTLNFDAAPGFRFREDLRTNMDWLAWLELSERGPVAHVRERLMDHRVHVESETARCLDDGTRRAEDALVLRRLWPWPVAGLIGRLYARSYREYL
jgi:glycosyltransferase involved in cell wall biosynthesis